MALCRLPLCEVADCLLSERSQQEVIRQLGHLQQTLHAQARSQEVTKIRRRVTGDRIRKIRKKKSQDNAKTHKVTRVGKIRRVTEMKPVTQDTKTSEVTKIAEKRGKVTKLGKVTQRGEVTKMKINPVTQDPKLDGRIRVTRIRKEVTSGQMNKMRKIKVLRQDNADAHSLTRTSEKRPRVTKSEVTRMSPFTKPQMRKVNEFYYPEAPNHTRPLAKIKNGNCVRQAPARVTRMQGVVTEGKAGVGKGNIASTRQEQSGRVKMKAVTESPSPDSLTRLTGIDKRITRSMRRNGAVTRSHCRTDDITSLKEEAGQITREEERGTEVDKNHKQISSHKPTRTDTVHHKQVTRKHQSQPRQLPITSTEGNQIKTHTTQDRVTKTMHGDNEAVTSTHSIQSQAVTKMPSPHTHQSLTRCKRHSRPHRTANQKAGKQGSGSPITERLGILLQDSILFLLPLLQAKHKVTRVEEKQKEEEEEKDYKEEEKEEEEEMKKCKQKEKNKKEKDSTYKYQEKEEEEKEEEEKWCDEEEEEEDKRKKGEEKSNNFCQHQEKKQEEEEEEEERKYYQEEKEEEEEEEEEKEEVEKKKKHNDKEEKEKINHEKEEKEKENYHHHHHHCKEEEEEEEEEDIWAELLAWYNQKRYLSFLEHSKHPTLPHYLTWHTGPLPAPEPAPIGPCLWYGALDSVGALAVTSLSLSPGAVFLDLCAGRGRHTQLAGEAMRDQGMIVTNSLSHHYLSRVGRLVSRCGLTSVLMTKLHLLDLPQSIQGRFSHVLLNAPCYNPTTTTTTATTGGGGGGVMQASGVWFLQHVLAAGVDALVCGGVLAYLTLSVRVEDNEQVIQKVRRTRQVEVVPLMPPPADYVDLRCEVSESGCLRITHLGSGGGGMYCLTKLRKVA